MVEKIIGYFLIFTGVLVIVLCSFNAISVLTKKSKPISFVDSQFTSSIAPTNDLKNPVSLNQMLNLDSEALTNIVNIGIHFLLLGFILKAGYHLASLGTMLVRPIVVDIHTIKDKK